MSGLRTGKEGEVAMAVDVAGREPNAKLGAGFWALFWLGLVLLVAASSGR
jgi:hypothetical protein